MVFGHVSGNLPLFPCRSRQISPGIPAKSARAAKRHDEVTDYEKWNPQSEKQLEEPMLVTARGI